LGSQCTNYLQQHKLVLTCVAWGADRKDAVLHSVIIFPCTYFVLSFMLSFDVIIFHGQQMLSFLCYHFPLYIFCVIIYVIITKYVQAKMITSNDIINDNALKMIT
jgi:hypothetical protein